MGCTTLVWPNFILNRSDMRNARVRTPLAAQNIHIQFFIVTRVVM